MNADSPIGFLQGLRLRVLGMNIDGCGFCFGSFASGASLFLQNANHSTGQHVAPTGLSQYSARASSIPASVLVQSAWAWASKIGAPGSRGDFLLVFLLVSSPRRVPYPFRSPQASCEEAFSGICRAIQQALAYPTGNDRFAPSANRGAERSGSGRGRGCPKAKSRPFSLPQVKTQTGGPKQKRATPELVGSSSREDQVGKDRSVDSGPRFRPKRSASFR